MECEFILKLSRNVKLEVFLQRMLSVDEFASIRTYSPCIVDSALEKLTFRHAILTDSKILLTQHPSRTIYSVTNIADVVSINKVDELPYFLQGKEQKNCQHVKLICRRRKMEDKRRRILSDGGVNNYKSKMSTSWGNLTRRNKSVSTSRDNLSQGLIISSKQEEDKYLTDTFPTTPTFISSHTWRLTPENFPRKSQSVVQYKNIDLSPIRSKSTSYVESMRKKSFGSLIDYANEVEVDQDEANLEEINLYILNPKSFFISVLLSVWDNYLICSTRKSENLIDTDDDEVFTRQLSPEKSGVVEKLFKDLSLELTEKCDSQEELYQLLQELKSSIKKHFIFPRLFWKDLKLINYLISQVKNNLAHSKCKETSLHQREDELELAVLILDIFCLSFRDEQTLLIRCLRLTANKYKLFEELTGLCVLTLQMPVEFVNTTRRMLTSFNQFKSNAWRNLPEAGLIDLSSEITNQQVQLLYHLFFAFNQILSTENVVNVVTSACVTISDCCDYFLPHFMTQFLTNFSLPQKFRPFQVILLYKYFHVLNILLCNCDRARLFISSSFSEEFRYYVDCQSIKTRICNSCLLKQPLINLISDVIKKIN